YSEETGESFPIVVRKPLEIRGTPNNKGYHVKIEGGGEFNSPTGAGQNVAIALLENSTLTGVNVTNQRDRGIGVWVEGASPTLLKNTLQQNDNTGVAINGTGRAVILDNYFYSNSGNGIVIYGQSQPTIKSNILERTGFGISITEASRPQVIGNEIKHNRIGIIVEGNAQPVIRENLITLSTEDGLVAIARSQPNLGTLDEPGRNIFRGNRGQAIKNLTKTYTIPASGNEISGETSGNIDVRATVAQNRPLPQQRNLSPLPTLSQPSDSNDTPVREQVWSAPNNSNRRSSSINQQSLPPLNTQQPLLPPASNNNQSASNQSPPSNLPPLKSPPRNTPERNNTNTASDSNRSSLQDILVLEPNASPTPRRNPNALPVPNGNIPSGNPFRPGTSPEQRVRQVGGQYRVIVEIRQASDKTRVKEIVPGAFTSRYQGRAVMQVGIFRSEVNAEEIRQRLQQAGLKVQVISM
ncbi:MAG: DUF1565 domain-containing protein, partial [Halothece sp. Uz-M2-17]|nr:DUF1565 domain-containing protein [Halothece sp. Uz-M2-17]